MSLIVKNIIFAILLIVIIVLFFNYYLSASSYLSELNPGNKLVKIDSSKLAINKNSNNYAYSIWFYVNDWQYKFSDKKNLIKRTTNGAEQKSNPYIYLDKYSNDIIIKITTVNNGDNENTCSVRNFPLQRWVNLIISLNGRTLDVYLDGKLVRTCILSGVAKAMGESDIELTPNGGFAGWTSRLKYWANPLNPQDAYNVYKKGPGVSDWSSVFEKYKLKVSYLVDNVEQGSFSI